MYNIKRFKNCLFEVVYLHQHVTFAWHSLDGNEMLLEIFAYSSNSLTFYGSELNL